MHKHISLFILSLFTLYSVNTFANRPDSVYIFAYNTKPSRGLSFAWSGNGKSWTTIGNEHSFISSDYAQWGTDKKMHSPSLTRFGQTWVLVFALDDRVNQLAISTSADLFHWQPQDYVFLEGVGQCLDPIAIADKSQVNVYFHNKAGQWFATATSDFYHFSKPIASDAPNDNRIKAFVNHNEYQGNVHRVAWAEVESIINFKLATDVRAQQNAESLADDAQRFAALGSDTIKATLTIDASSPLAISDKLLGIFFEDINYSADGGLYAELVQNRDFEYDTHEHGREENWGSSQSWKLVGEGTSFTISTDSPLNDIQKHYAVLDVKTVGAALVNDGFDGIVVKNGARYDISFFARQLAGKAAQVRIELRNDDRVIGSAVLKAPTNSWQQYTAVIKATASATNATLAIIPTAPGSVALDFVSLFPQDTYKARKNGMRRDLAEALEALHPRFMRFPGGCLVHGQGIDNIYHWKQTIGPLWERTPQPNIWNYHQSRGLGYFEFFQLCEDLGCEPLPVVAAGVPCQNTAITSLGGGQQGGIPLGQPMQQYIQDVLDLIEWANGDPKTSTWARKRAEAGHPKPFNLKYLGIGNEDLISQAFTERYLMIINAVKERYPDITVCGTTGPFFEGSDYERGWQLAKQHNIDMVDEHYYVSPGWFINNQHFYDNYDRSASKVYLGEYASHIPGRHSTIETALTCAIQICNMERNGDVVAMSSYAPLLAKHGHTQWNPDLIYFDNQQVYTTVDYEVQRMCGQSQGDQYLPSTFMANNAKADVARRLSTSTVHDTKTGRTYIKLVNLLPNPINADINLNQIASILPKGASLNNIPAQLILLTGSYNEQKARASEPSDIVLREHTNINLPPYSFTIIQF